MTRQAKLCQFGKRLTHQMPQLVLCATLHVAAGQGNRGHDGWPDITSPEASRKSATQQQRRAELKGKETAGLTKKTGHSQTTVGMPQA